MMAQLRAPLSSMRAFRTLSFLTPLLVIVSATDSSGRTSSCPAFATKNLPTTQQRISTPRGSLVTPAVESSSSSSSSSRNSNSILSAKMSSTVNPDESAQDPVISQNTDSNDNDKVQACIARLRDRGIKVVIFDMDLTIVNQHSRGRLQRQDLEAFLAKTLPDFVKLVPELHKQGFQLAIATHSDEAEYSTKVTPELYIIGTELATTVLQRNFEPEVANSFFIVAYNPYVRVSLMQTMFFGGWAKRYHMALIQNHYQVQPNEMLMIDDTKPIVKDCIKKCGVQAIDVSPLTGFSMDDILKKL